MPEIKDISKDNFDTDVLGSDTPTLVYYHAPWCKPCKDVEKVLQTATEQIKEGIDFVRVNTDQEQEIVTQQKILTIPYFQLFNKSTVIGSINGVPSALELLGLLNEAVSENAQKEEASK